MTTTTRTLLLLLLLAAAGAVGATGAGVNQDHSTVQYSTDPQSPAKVVTLPPAVHTFDDRIGESW